MEYTKWIILFGCIVFSDSALFLRQVSEKHVIADRLKRAINDTIRGNVPTNNKTMNCKQITGEDAEHDPLILAKIECTEIRPPVDGFTLKLQEMVSLIVFLQYYNQSFATGAFPVKGMVNFTAQNKDPNGRVAKSNDYVFKAEFSDVDQIKLLPNNFNKPKEEEELTHEAKKFITKIIEEKLEEDTRTKDLQNQLSSFNGTISVHLGELLNNTKRYHPIGSIPTSNYTLNIVTIEGLWNVQSLNVNSSDSGVFVQLGLGAVTGSMMQYFHFEKKGPLELSFNASNIHIYENQTATGHKVECKITGYFVKNIKTNLPLEENESKSIMKHVELAFTASLYQNTTT